MLVRAVLELGLRSFICPTVETKTLFGKELAKVTHAHYEKEEDQGPILEGYLIVSTNKKSNNVKHNGKVHNCLDTMRIILRTDQHFAFN